MVYFLNQFRMSRFPKTYIIPVELCGANLCFSSVVLSHFIKNTTSTSVVSEDAATLSGELLD